ncbi:hypothetical protein KY495_15140 [Massilia sp. PAMC28688]|uniref:hypothetical protein n=1 Tax=Massilia sp. PAMC28688 TaxID=2861283 RepID=UPI001C635F22|nr:hypothetical protein [Massilia sp. PAMC28688]QYF92100.1 hypothetical protein KY495_15140 [Massilia sp. PAMC28688]
MTATNPIGRSVLGAVFILGGAALLNWLSPAHLSVEWSQRLMGTLLGAVVVVYANAIPKALASLASVRCTPAQEQAARRFAGWSLVLGGLAYMLASLLAPLEHASVVGGVLLAIALFAAILRYVRING